MFERKDLIILIFSLVGSIATFAFPEVPRWIWKLIVGIFIFWLIRLLISHFYENRIKPKIQEIRHMMWPIVLMGLGVFLFIILFGVGAIWFYINQAKEVAISRQAVTPPQPSINPQSTTINQLEEITKKQVRLYLLKRNLPKFIALKEQYEIKSTAKLNKYLAQAPDANDEDFDLRECIGTIQDFWRENFNEDIDLHKINTAQYDLNMPLTEEKKIDDEKAKYLYRKSKYQFMSGKAKLTMMMSKITDEIGHNEGFIENYARSIISR